ncbi:MAG: DUF378 domain-containing protein [Alphaproteobacteria bacterium]|nr:DUF378 domain-containing protein [Alphaproteobacteria bacterium]
MKHIGLISQILLIVGGINWGLYGLMGMDLVAMLFGSIPVLAKLIYMLVGLSGVHALYTNFIKK